MLQPLLQILYRLVTLVNWKLLKLWQPRKFFQLWILMIPLELGNFDNLGDYLG